jgi:magnesium transporter
VNPVAALIEPEVIELIRAGNYAELREALHTVPPADVADILTDLDPEEAAIAFRFLPRDDCAEVFAYLQPAVQEELIKRLGEKGALRIVEAMDPDDRVRLLDELPAEVAGRIVASLAPDERKATQAILGYPPRSVGRLMTPDYVRIKPEWTVARALEHVRRNGRDAETINVVYVVDDSGLLVDDLRLRQLIIADPDAPVESLMNRQFITLKADQPQDEAVAALQKYDRVALPVVDSRGALLGIVTHDDVADVAQQEATEDMQMLGAVQALEEPYMTASIGGLFKKRAPWLALLFMSELLTSNAIAFFENEIQRAAVLAAFIPAIISSGGNSGSQSSTLVIRALGLREITLADWAAVLFRELRVSLLLGALIGTIGLFRIHLFGWMGWFADAEVREHYSILGITIALTLLFVVVWGSVMGAMLPFILKRLRLDPAASSTPFVATLVDVTGIVIYFSCAIFFLKTTLLSPDAPDHTLRTTADVSVVSIERANTRAGTLELLVLPLAAPPNTPPSPVTIPLKGLPNHSPPLPGTRLRLTLPTGDAERAEALQTPPSP